MSDSKLYVRPRTHTDKGAEFYETNREKYEKKLEHLWKLVEGSVNTKLDIVNVNNVTQKRHDITHYYGSFCALFEEFKAFMIRTNTSKSIKDYEQYMTSVAPRIKCVQQTFVNLDKLQQELLETSTKTSSEKTRTTSTKRTVKSRSTTSSLSDKIATMKAKAEVAKVRMQFAEREAQLRKQNALLEEEQKLSIAKSSALIERQKVELEAEMRVLSHQTAAAAAEAEFKTLEHEIGESESNLTAYNLVQNGVQNSTERTFDFVNQQARLEKVDSHLVNPPEISADFESPVDFHIQRPVKENVPRLNPNARPFLSTKPEPVIQDVCITSELTRFLLKKDLLLSRLIPYNDKPESFFSWKSSFKGIMRELNVNPSEELDLLVKYLGPESSSYAYSIRTSNCHDSIKGLERLWERLNERYGCPELIDAALRQKLERFPILTVKDSKKLYDLVDILCEIQAVKEDPRFCQLLSFYDTSSGILPVIRKLPPPIQEKWTNHAVRFKKQHNVIFPPFSCLVEFVREISRVKNDPSFSYETSTVNGPSNVSKDRNFGKNFSKQRFTNKSAVGSMKTEVKPNSDSKNEISNICPLHKTNHTLNSCRAFRGKPLDERRKFLLDQGICFRCCASTSHRKRDCHDEVECCECRSKTHPSALHITKSPTPDGGEKNLDCNTEVKNRCTQICGQNFSGKSCSKTVLVKVYKDNNPDKAIMAYLILDDQSNRSLIASELFDLLDLTGEPSEYKLTSCAGTFKTSGRRANGLTVESLDGTRLSLPTLIECDLPNIREEIPSPAVAKYHAHLCDIADNIPEIDETAPIALLIGRDLPEAHHVIEQVTGPRKSPYAQRLQLGWVVIGEVCLSAIHRPEVVTVNKTYLLRNGRSSICKPCPNSFQIKENLSFIEPKSKHEASNLETDLFVRTDKDDMIGLSIDDIEFLNIMDEKVVKNAQGYWEAPLPFRSPRLKLPDNRLQALRRARSLDCSLRKDTVKREHFLAFMKNIIDNNHAEIAPAMDESEEHWYLPIFGVYHPKKPSKIRVVFDSSAKFNNVSLNDVLLTGPDMINSLVGVLMRFRKDLVAVSADIQQMFFCFVVSEEHRNFLRFFWYRDNDPAKELVEYRMRVHVFGNSPSPAVASYGLQKAAKSAEDAYGADVVEFIHENFYVDDGLTSLPTAEEAIDLLKRTQEALMNNGTIRLHKIASNNQEVMNAFCQDDIASDVKDKDLSVSEPAMQRSLGLYWTLQTDSFTYRMNLSDKPFSRRGILSVVNSLFDPLGFIAPVAISGKLILREVMNETKSWDEPLPDNMRDKWDRWKCSLQALDKLYVPRTYTDISWTELTQKDVYIYCDASEKAVAAVAFLRAVDKTGIVHVGFIMGKVKVAPVHGHSIPRLELCAAVLAVEVSEIVSSELDIDRESFKFFSDSQVVLGYIHNTTRRFYMYVSNRVAKIRKLSEPSQWSYVRTDVNPADAATRSVPADKLQDNMWLTGPPQIFDNPSDSKETVFPLLNPEEDKEIRINVNVLKSSLHDDTDIELTHRCERFSVWKRLVNAFGKLRSFARTYRKVDSDKHTDVTDYQEAERFIIRRIQNEIFQTDIDCIRNKLPLSRNSRIRNLNPFLDDIGILRVGGRITRADIDFRQRHPIIIPGNHHIAELLIRHFHSEVKHQGRHFTAGALRDAGFWILGEKRRISSLIHKCVICRKLRGKQEQQLMSDLPVGRITPSPPFSSVGIDTFGPWSVVTRKTRGGHANNKRWALLFTCLSTRAIHIEVIEELSSSSFINALRRFIALRGSVKEIYSDRGTNFIGSVDSLDIHAINVEEGPVRKFLNDKQTVWIFNPPHSSHMGGIWERMIGITRRILDSMILEIQAKNLTHEVLTTFLAEVSAIVNGRPLVPVSSDPEAPLILSPATLLTQKTGCDPAPVGTFDTKDLYKAQWRRVQYLADTFWRRWSKEYLQSLQTRRKWTDTSPDLKNGDVVLIKDKNLSRNEWATGIVANALPGADGRVRKVEVRNARNGSTYTRPISEMILLLPA